MEGYYDAVKERELLESEHDELKDKFGLLEDETSKKVDEVMKKLKDQHNKVINPLVKELKVSTELQNRLKADLDRNLKEMKEMSAILRIPTLTAEFQRMLRAKETEKKIEADKKKAISHMVESKITDDESRTAYLKNMVDVVDRIKQLKFTDKDSRYQSEMLRSQYSCS